MNAHKQKNLIQKTLVRNTEKPVQKCKVVPDAPTETEKKDSKNLNPADSKKTISERNKPQTKFDVPTLCSTLKLSKKIDEISKPRKTKSLSDVGHKKLAVDEKVTQKINFPYSEPNFRNLIPLSVSQAPSQPLVASREPLPHKDKEPLLVDFVEQKTVPDYYSLPSVKIENRTLLVKSNNLRLYKMLELNDK
ncbi:uncharacterized protein [Leptinotarsa decemlineata]|uniref:uncharacterized protein n=1 Tax=Leptinotarsa decemlineata TaxID=7539 RepID=UPI000C251D7A|nr:uncharacterized protein LOC111514487 [Leptinotarsa decemlineata]